MLIFSAAASASQQPCPHTHTGAPLQQMLAQVAGLREERRRWQALLASQATLQNEVDMWRHRWGLFIIYEISCPVKVAAHACVSSSCCVWNSSGFPSFCMHLAGGKMTKPISELEKATIVAQCV